MGGIGAVFALIPFLSSMSPSEKTKTAAAPIEIDISKIQPGTFKVVAWRGKPVWIVRRTDEMISQIKDNSIHIKNIDKYRTKNKKLIQ